MTTTERPRRGRGTAIGEGITWLARWSLRLVLVALGIWLIGWLIGVAVVDHAAGDHGRDHRDGALAADGVAAQAPLPARARRRDRAAPRARRARRGDRTHRHVGGGQHPADRGQRVLRRPVDPAVALRPAAQPRAEPARRGAADRHRPTAGEHLLDHHQRAHRRRVRCVRCGHGPADAGARVPVREGRAAVPAVGPRGRRRLARAATSPRCCAGSGGPSPTSYACRLSWRWSTGC